MITNYEFNYWVPAKCGISPNGIRTGSSTSLSTKPPIPDPRIIPIETGRASPISFCWICCWIYFTAFWICCRRGIELLLMLLVPEVSPRSFTVQDEGPANIIIGFQANDNDPMINNYQ